jgi:hypothetical protein
MAVDDVTTRQPGLPRSAGMWPGDMMIDWVSSRSAGDAAAHTFQAVRCLLHVRSRVRLTACWPEPAAVVASSVDDGALIATVAALISASSLPVVGCPRPGQVLVSASSPSSVRM